MKYLICNITGIAGDDIDKMVFKEFDELAEISTIVANYLRGDKLETLTIKGREKLESERIKRFKKMGLL